MATAVIVKVWTFLSDSNPNVNYETLQYSDGATSCNCKGWTRRTTADGLRSCKHTRLVDQGVADKHCKSACDYQGGSAPAPTGPVIRTKGKRNSAGLVEMKLTRRFNLES